MVFLAVTLSKIVSLTTTTLRSYTIYVWVSPTYHPPFILVILIVLPLKRQSQYYPSITMIILICMSLHESTQLGSPTVLRSQAVT